MIALSMLSYANDAKAQTMPTMLDESNRFIRENTTQIDKSGWFYFKTEALIAPSELFTKYKEYTGLSENDQIYLVRTKEDPKYNATHLRYQQYYKNLRVEGAEFDEHLQNCIVTVANGKLIEGLDLDASPAYDEGVALEFALNHIGADEYAWQNPEMERELQKDEDNPQATHFPTGELLWTVGNNPEIVKDSYILCWAFNISAIKPYASKRIYINAQTGGVFADQDRDLHDGPATLINGYGTKTIDTEWRGGIHSNHRLKTNNNGLNIHTKDAKNRNKSFGGSSEVTDTDDNWNSGGAQSKAATAHWVISKSWEYFNTIHNRSGIDGQGSKMKVITNFNKLPRFFGGASFSPDNDNIRFDSPEAFTTVFGTPTDIEALDVAGHEYAHGVAKYAAGLGGFFEPGALGESFGDIFGVMIEGFAKGGITNWTVGEDANFTLRSLSDPMSIPADPLPIIPPTFGDPGDPGRPSMGLPDTYKASPHWYNGRQDRGGVHINCGVQNKWFYLLANGGAHNGITISGIGTTKAAAITYYSLNSFIQATSVYADARNASIRRCCNGNISFMNLLKFNFLDIGHFWAFRYG